MPREVTQRDWDRQERFAKNFEKASAKFAEDMRILDRLIEEYPEQISRHLRKRKARRL